MESDRHYDGKVKIKESLENELKNKGDLRFSLNVEERVKINDNEFLVPDILVKCFNNKRIAIEIQLSNISRFSRKNKYIKYRSCGIECIYIYIIKHDKRLMKNVWTENSILLYENYKVCKYNIPELNIIKRKSITDFTKYDINDMSSFLYYIASDNIYKYNYKRLIMELSEAEKAMQFDSLFSYTDEDKKQMKKECDDFENSFKT